MVMPSPYIVTLVSPDKKVTKRRGRKTAVLPKKIIRKKAAIANAEKPVISQKNYVAKVEKPVISQKNHVAKAEKPVISRKNYVEKNRKLKDTLVENRISEIEAKKRIENIVRMRSLISLTKSAEPDKENVPVESSDSGSFEGGVFTSYYTKITNEIWQEWVYPDTGEEGLETIVFVKIAKDGTVRVKGIEKSSSNILFDRSALTALAKASPVTPPPYEMEIGIRFYP
jgi:colicin import membrane protein